MENVEIPDRLAPAGDTGEAHESFSWGNATSCITSKKHGIISSMENHLDSDYENAEAALIGAIKDFRLIRTRSGLCDASIEAFRKIVKPYIECRVAFVKQKQGKFAGKNWGSYLVTWGLLETDVQQLENRVLHELVERVANLESVCGTSPTTSIVASTKDALKKL